MVRRKNEIWKAGDFVTGSRLQSVPEGHKRDPFDKVSEGPVVNVSNRNSWLFSLPL